MSSAEEVNQASTADAACPQEAPKQTAEQTQEDHSTNHDGMAEDAEDPQIGQKRRFTIQEKRSYAREKKKTAKKSMLEERLAEFQGTTSSEPCPLCGATEAPFYHYGQATDRAFYACQSCKLVFVNKFVSEEQERERYLQHNNDPGDIRYQAFLGRIVDPLVQLLNATLLEETAGKPASGASNADGSSTESSEERKIAAPSSAQKNACLGMDFGCGPGPAISRLMARHGYPVCDYDPNFFPDPVIPKLYKPLDEEDKDEAEKPPLERKFRFITCTEVLEHIKEPVPFLADLYNRLTPGGVLAIMTGILTEDSLFPGWHYHRDYTHIRFYRPETLKYIESLHDWKLSRPHKDVAFFVRNK